MKLLPNVMVYEYYADEILWNKTAADVHHILLEDLRAYHRIGVRHISMLTFNYFSTFAHKLNMWLFLRGTWDLNSDVDELAAEFCGIVYRDQKEAALQAYRLREKASKLWLQFCGYSRLSDIRDIPPQNEPFMHKHIRDMEESIHLWKEAVTLLRESQQKTDDVRVVYQLESDAICLELSIRQLTCCREQMTARMQKAYHGLSTEKFAEAMDCCIQMMRELRSFIESLPSHLLGVDQSDRLVNHLCNDQISFYQTLKEEALTERSGESDLHIIR